MQVTITRSCGHSDRIGVFGATAAGLPTLHGTLHSEVAPSED